MTLHPWLPRPLFLAVFAALAALIALPQVCFACSCAVPKPPLEAAADAAAVFRGEVTRVERLPRSTGGDYQRVTLRVNRVWKGNVAAEAVVYTGSNDGDCGIAFQQGTEYVIYAWALASDNLWNAPENSLGTGLCDRTAPVSQAADDLAALGPGQPPAPGMPNTGAGMSDTASERIIPGELLIGGAILAFLAVIQRSRSNGRVARG
jgi:hypothetical protein